MAVEKIDDSALKVLVVSHKLEESGKRLEDLLKLYTRGAVREDYLAAELEKVREVIKNSVVVCLDFPYIGNEPAKKGIEAIVSIDRIILLFKLGK